MSWIPYFCVLLVLPVIQVSIRRAMGPAMRVGDESAYISCGGQADPFAPGLFLRVPLMAWLSKQAHRFTSNPEHTLRAATSVASTVSILVTMLCAQILGGTKAAFLVGLLLVLMPGRIILSHHIWPDIWLGLWLSLACLIMIYPEMQPAHRAILLGTVAALAFMTRFDAILLAPFAGLGMTALSALDWILILMPVLITFFILSLRNARRYQVPWPDTTWMFNIMITAGESRHERATDVHVEQEVLLVVADWKKLDDRGKIAGSLASLQKLFTRPVKALSGVLLRLWASLGQDSFVLHRLLPPEGTAYPEISGRTLRGLQFALAVAFPVFASAIFLAFLIAGPPAPVILMPTLALAAGSLLHNRTRYRQAWLPGAALMFTSAIFEPGFWPALLSANSTLEWIFCVAFGFMLIRYPARPDTRQAP